MTMVMTIIIMLYVKKKHNYKCLFIMKRSFRNMYELQEENKCKYIEKKKKKKSE